MRGCKQVLSSREDLPDCFERPLQILCDVSRKWGFENQTDVDSNFTSAFLADVNLDTSYPVWVSVLLTGKMGIMISIFQICFGTINNKNKAVPKTELDSAEDLPSLHHSK